MFNPDWTNGAPFGERTPEAEILNEHVFCDYPPGIGTVGFRLHRHGARFGRWPLLWQILEHDPLLKVISLSRTNLLRRYLSYRIMRERKDSPRAPKFMTEEELTSEFILQEALIEAFNIRFAKHPILHISYEQLCNDWGQTIRRVQEFIGVAPIDLLPTTIANRRSRLAGAIEDFDDLASRFEKTRWAKFFDESTN
jgi:hypothetical protein